MGRVIGQFWVSKRFFFELHQLRRDISLRNADCDDGKRLVVRADEKLSAFVELESATRAHGELAYL